MAHRLHVYIKNMPEGPSIFILKEDIIKFQGKKILQAHGNAKIDMARITGKKLVEIRTWGKQLFLVMPKVTIRIHLLMFGSYSVDEQTRPSKSLRLALEFSKGTIYFYTCSVKLLEPGWENEYDWEADVLSDEWNPRAARKKLKEMPKALVCDALLDQKVFSGVGNIIKNEVLYRIFLHPETVVGEIPVSVTTKLIKEARNYSFDFLKWKKKFELKKHWLAHTKKTCLRCELPLVKKYCGKTKRRTFFCVNCQVKYG
jgi:endonuclease-8